MERNPEINQDRVHDLFDHFDKYGYGMFPQQVEIYQDIAERIRGKSVIEAGCGNGLGTAVLERKAASIIGTDKLQKNVDFANVLYPWIPFETWDINESTSLRASVVVCIETIEHVRNPSDAIRNLLLASHEEVWITTPNGEDKERPPNNPYHVQEYTQKEILDMIEWGYNVNVSGKDPLVYHIRKGNKVC